MSPSTPSSPSSTSPSTRSSNLHRRQSAPMEARIRVFSEPNATVNLPPVPPIPLRSAFRKTFVVTSPVSAKATETSMTAVRVDVNTPEKAAAGKRGRVETEENNTTEILTQRMARLRTSTSTSPSHQAQTMTPKISPIAPASPEHSRRAPPPPPLDLKSVTESQQRPRALTSPENQTAQQSSFTASSKPSPRTPRTPNFSRFIPKWTPKSKESASSSTEKGEEKEKGKGKEPEPPPQFDYEAVRAEMIRKAREESQTESKNAVRQIERQEREEMEAKVEKARREREAEERYRERMKLYAKWQVQREEGRGEEE